MVHDFLPVLLGSDMNAYGMARAFHEKYGIVSKAFAKTTLNATLHSSIIDVTEVEDFENPAVFIKTLTDFGKLCSGDKKLLLIACGDSYAELCINKKRALSKYYIVPYINKTLKDKLVTKTGFYNMCNKLGISYPKTQIVGQDNYRTAELPFNFPVIIKPSYSKKYWACEFDGKKKVYKAESREEMDEIIRRIYTSEYDDTMIIQEFIPGGDSHMRVVNAYCDKNSNVKLMVMGRVLLEEHTPMGIGSYGAIAGVNEPNLYRTIKNFVESVKFVGVANFDVKFDSRDETYSFFEINLRQGRSSYYATAFGYNLAEYFVRDYIYDDLENEPLVIGKKEHLWTVIPMSVIKRYTVDRMLLKHAKELRKKGEITNSLFYKKDMSVRRLYTQMLTYLNYNRKYFIYFNKRGLD